MVHHRFVAGDRLEHVPVCERQYRLSSGLRRLRAHVEIHGHPLPRAGRRIVEREVLDKPLHFFALTLADTHAELRGGVLPVPYVPEVRVYLSGEEEGMRRREGRHRPARAFGNQHPVGRFHRHPCFVLHPAELVLLWVAARVPPDHSWRQVCREAVQARLVLVGHRRLLRLGDRVHSDQVRAAIHREAQVPSKDSHRQARKRHLEACPIRLHAARGCVERRARAADLLGRARQADIAWIPPFLHTRDEQRRIPKHVPFLPFDHLRRDLDAEITEWRHLLIRQSAYAAGHVILRYQVLAQRCPLIAVAPDGQVAYDRPRAIDRVPRAQLGVALTCPRDDEQVLFDRCRETGACLVLTQVTRKRVGKKRRGGHERQNVREEHSHVRPPPPQAPGARGRVRSRKRLCDATVRSHPSPESETSHRSARRATGTRAGTLQPHRGASCLGSFSNNFKVACNTTTTCPLKRRLNEGVSRPSWFAP